ncbi:hypothetical protein MMC34_004304 [Xylographa carneopallida]|nr:hypothetical protein [Xylographa carneopallida]
MRPILPIFKRIVLEVERKFACNTNTTRIIHANSGSPRLPNLIFKGQHTFEDIYYDLDEVCFTHGVWIRKRDGMWQAKIRQGGNFTNSQFDEVDGAEDVAALLQKLNVDASIKAENLGLSEVARFVTQRDAWKVADTYEVVVDITDFGHSVGEVELQQLLESDNRDDGTAAVQMDARIKDFMLKHSWAFPSGKVVGKLSAYFEWARANKNS